MSLFVDYERLMLHNLTILRFVRSTFGSWLLNVAKLWDDDRSAGTTVAKADHEMLYKRSLRIV